MAGMLLRKYLFRLIRQTGAELLVLILGIRMSRLRAIFALATIGMEQEHRGNIQAACGQLRNCAWMWIPITGTRTRVTLPDRGM